MNQQEFNKVVEETWETIQTLLTVKGGEYAGTEDRLGNFKRGSNLSGAHSLQVLFIYLAKHYDAFATYVRDTASGESRPRSESITGRLDDIINYCILAKALVRELEKEAEESKRDKIFVDPVKAFEYLKEAPKEIKLVETFAPHPDSPSFSGFRWKNSWWVKPNSFQRDNKWIRVCGDVSSNDEIHTSLLATYYSGAWNV